MKFLIDNALSEVVSDALSKLGHDSLHVREIGLQHAADETIFQKAFEEKRTIISADTDFGWLLSKWNHNKPSVILFRKGVERDPMQQVKLLKNRPALPMTDYSLSSFNCYRFSATLLGLLLLNRQK